MSYDHIAVKNYVDRAKKLGALEFKMLYIWLTECLEWAMSPRGVPRELIESYGQLRPWERANTVDQLGRHLVELSKEDFRKLADSAREWDESMERARSTGDRHDPREGV